MNIDRFEIVKTKTKHAPKGTPEKQNIKPSGLFSEIFYPDRSDFNTSYQVGVIEKTQETQERIIKIMLLIAKGDDYSIVSEILNFAKYNKVGGHHFEWEIREIK